MADYANLPIGLRVQTQIPLDIKANVINVATLSSLGVDYNLAFTYYEGLIVNCLEDNLLYKWREVQETEPVPGIIATGNFEYPSMPAVYGIDYSGRRFNFFPVSLTGPAGPTGPTGPTGATGATGPTGPQGVPGVDAVNNLQKTITSNYSLVLGDNNYSIIINNGVSNVTITVPPLASNAYNVGFIQQGTGDVTFAASGVTINTPVGLKIQGQHYQAYIEQVGVSGVYQLLGNLKV